MVLLLDLTVNYAACLDLCCSINPNKQHAACLDLDCVFYAVRNMSCKVMNVKHLLYTLQPTAQISMYHDPRSGALDLSQRSDNLN